MNEQDDFVSKSELKRQMQHLQMLGERLVNLSDAQLDGFELPDDLLEAISLAKRISKRGGYKRQLQYIGKLMRHIDPEDIEQKFEALDQGHQHDVEQFHLVEHWRDRLLASNQKQAQADLTELIDQFPGCDVQRLRQLQREALQTKNLAKQKNAARALFRLLSDIVIVE